LPRDQLDLASDARIRFLERRYRMWALLYLVDHEMAPGGQEDRDFRRFCEMLCWHAVASNPMLQVRLRPVSLPEGQAPVRRDWNTGEVAEH
jgi:hypothetical protein